MRIELMFIPYASVFSALRLRVLMMCLWYGRIY